MSSTETGFADPLMPTEPLANVSAVPRRTSYLLGAFGSFVILGLFVLVAVLAFRDAKEKRSWPEIEAVVDVSLQTPSEQGELRVRYLVDEKWVYATGEPPVDVVLKPQSRIVVRVDPNDASRFLLAVPSPMAWIVVSSVVAVAAAVIGIVFLQLALSPESASLGERRDIVFSSSSARFARPVEEMTNDRFESSGRYALPEPGVVSMLSRWWFWAAIVLGLVLAGYGLVWLSGAVHLTYGLGAAILLGGAALLGIASPRDGASGADNVILWGLSSMACLIVVIVGATLMAGAFLGLEFP